MSHNLRQGVDVAAPFEHETGEGVAEGVGGEIDLRALAETFDESLDPFVAKGLVMAHGNEEVRGFAFETSTVNHVFAQDGGEASVDRDHAILVSFALVNEDAFTFDRDILALEIGNFASPQACHEHDANDGTVAVAFEFVSVE